VLQFELAHDAPWFTPDGRLQVDDPAVRAGMVEALTDYTAIWRKGCTQAFYEREDAAFREIIAAFERETGKQVELVQPAMDEMFEQANAALEAGAARLAFPLLSTSNCLKSRSPGPQQA
jgi:hypothetical protein